MKLQRKGTRQSHRGVIGVESAIVMIAFVIVAAALAFVVLNMGFSTSQKAKTTIISSLGESSSALEVSGKVTGVGCTDTDCGGGTDPLLNATAIPIKVTAGGDSIDLANATTTVKYLSNSVNYDDIYVGTITDLEYRSLSLAFDRANNDMGGFECPGEAHNNQPVTGEAACRTAAFIYWPVSGTVINSILDQGEHAVLAVAFEEGDRPQALDKIRVELIIATGASLSIERQVPTITTSTVDLG